MFGLFKKKNPQIIIEAERGLQEKATKLRSEIAELLETIKVATNTEIVRQKLEQMETCGITDEQRRKVVSDRLTEIEKQ